MSCKYKSLEYFVFLVLLAGCSSSEVTSLPPSNQLSPSDPQQPELANPRIEEKTGRQHNQVYLGPPSDKQSIHKSDVSVPTHSSLVVRHQTWQISEPTQNTLEQAEAERIEAEQLAAAQAEAQRIAAQKAEEQWLLALKVEQEPIAAEQAEAERLEAEQLAAAQAEAQRIAAQKAEAQRLLALKAEQERIAAEQAEAERLEAERIEELNNSLLLKQKLSALPLKKQKHNACLHSKPNKSALLLNRQKPNG